MLTDKGDINWVATLASIARDKGMYELADYIGKFSETPKVLVHYTSEEGVKDIVEAGVITPDYSKLNNKTFKITVMPEATCDGCQ